MDVPLISLASSLEEVNTWAQSLPASWGANAASAIATHIGRLAEFLAMPDEGGFTAAAVYHVFVTNEATVVLTKIFKDVTPPES